MPSTLPHQPDHTTTTASSNARVGENQIDRGEAEALPITQDREHTEAHVWALTGSTDTPMAWRLIPPARLKGRLHARNLLGTITECWDQLVAANRDGYGIFFIIQGTDGKGFKGTNVVGFRAAFVEDDSGTLTWQSVSAAGLPPSFVVRSKAGLHIYFKIAPGEDVSDCKPLLRALAAKLGTDPNVADTARVLRAAGFAHTKEEEPFDVRIVPEACDRPALRPAPPSARPQPPAPPPRTTPRRRRTSSSRRPRSTPPIRAAPRGRVRSKAPGTRRSARSRSGAPCSSGT